MSYFTSAAPETTVCLLDDSNVSDKNVEIP
jgi:hypothetical protein